MAEETPTETAPPATAADGTYLDGKYPANHRLRAEALHADGLAEDPDGVVSPELIADAGERIARDKAAAAAAAETEPLDGLKRADLEELALTEGVDLSSARTNAERAKLIEDGRAARAAATATAGAPGTGDNNEPGAKAGEGEGA